MPATETSFKELAGVPVHYDRLPAPNGYGSKGKSRAFECRNRLKSTLNECFEELFDVWGRDSPSLILTAPEQLAMEKTLMAKGLPSI